MIKELQEDGKLKLAKDLNVVPVKVLAAICRELVERDITTLEVLPPSEEEKMEVTDQSEGKTESDVLPVGHSKKEEIDRTAKATKADDDAVPVTLR